MPNQLYFYSQNEYLKDKLVDIWSSAQV
jgi:hypothetical protein